jgi:hypothetical protein
MRKQACDHQQHHRGGDLQGHQAIAQPVVACGHAAPALVQHCTHVGARDTQRGHHPHYEPGQRSNQK